MFKSKTGQVNIEFWLSALTLSLNGLVSVCSTVIIDEDDEDDDTEVRPQRFYLLLYTHMWDARDTKLTLSCYTRFLYQVKNISLALLIQLKEG